jgi:hypothetical protein
MGAAAMEIGRLKTIGPLSGAIFDDMIFVF